MDLHDLIGDGVCHREAARTLEGAWLCVRCTGLYAGGLSGVWLALRFRSLGLGLQVVVCLLLITPMGVDGLLLGRGSPMDVAWFRLLTGILAGVGSGLFLGARGLPHVAWPGPLSRVARPDWAWALGLPAVATAAQFLGLPLPMDVVVFAGLAALCLAGSAWALHLTGWFMTRFRLAGPASGGFPAAALALLVVCELALVSVTPASFKPSGRWFHGVVGWVTDLLSG